MRFKRILKFLGLSLVVFVLGVVFYAFQIEPYQINIEENHMVINEHTEEGIKIIHISDTHIKKNYNAKQLNKIVDEINVQNPDIVVFTGDLYDNHSTYNDDENVVDALSRISAKYGKLSIWGNHDYGGHAEHYYEDIMLASGFELLRNEGTDVVLDNKKTIHFEGIDDSLLGDPDYHLDFDKGDSDYVIVLSHEPDVVDFMTGTEFDLFLSGHSHGGQVHFPPIPFVNRKALEITKYAEIYTEGLYDVHNKNSKIFVNTGLGTSHVSVRIGVRPTITVHYLYL